MKRSRKNLGVESSWAYSATIRIKIIGENRAAIARLCVSWTKNYVEGNPISVLNVRNTTIIVLMEQTPIALPVLTSSKDPLRPR
jgi:hypothetical protein